MFAKKKAVWYHEKGKMNQFITRKEIIMKKIICALLALVMMLSLAACGGAAEPKTDNVVTVWAWDEAFNIKAANEAAAIYKTINPDVTIEVVTMAQDDIVQKLNTALAAGSYEGLPEVVLVEDYRIQGFLKNFGNEFADLSDIAKPEDFASFKTAVNVVDGKLYGIPFDSGVAAMFYRLDLVEEAGYTEADMQNITWEKYIEVGKAIKEKCGVDMMTMDPSDLGQIRMMLQSAGSWYTDAEGKVAVANNPAMVAAVETYLDLFNSGVTIEAVGWDQFVGAFQTGKVWSVSNGCWISASVVAAEDLAGKWAVAPFPRMGRYEGSANGSSCGGAGWYVLKNVGDTDAAKDYIKNTFASSVELMNTLATEINLISTLNAASSAENYAKGVDFYGGQAIFADLFAWQDNVPAVNYGMHTYQIESKMTEAVQAIKDGGDIETVLADYQAQIEAEVR